MAPSVIEVARPEKTDKSGSHLRRLSWLAMCLHSAGAFFFSLDELSLLYSKLFPSPGAGPLLLESLIELCQGPLPILACDSTSAVGLTPLGLAASSIRQALVATGPTGTSTTGLGYASPVSRLVEEWGSSVEDVLEVLTTTDGNCGPSWLEMIHIVHTPTIDPMSPNPTTAVVKLRNLFRQCVSPDVMSFITGRRVSSSMVNLALTSKSDDEDERDDDDNEAEGTEAHEEYEERQRALSSAAHKALARRRASAPAIRNRYQHTTPATLGLAGALMVTPPKSPPKSSLLLRLGGNLLHDHREVSPEIENFEDFQTLLTGPSHETTTTTNDDDSHQNAF